MSEKRSPVPLLRDSKGHRITIHGEGAYKRGCGCQVCLDGHATAEQNRRAARSSRKPASARRAAAQPANRMPGQAIRNIPVTALLSQDEAAAFTAHITALFDSESGFIRDLILNAIGYEDTARRPARRRPNRKQQASTEGHHA